MNSEAENTNFEMAWTRIKEVTGWSKYKELAAFVDSSTESIAGIKKRGRFPLDWAFRIANEYNSNTDWIMTGVDKTRRGTTATEPVAAAKAAVADPGEPFAQAAESEELCRLLKRYGNRALVEDVKARLLKIKQVVEG